MKKEYLGLLCCPRCKGKLTLNILKEIDGDITDGTLTCHSCNTIYKIDDGIPVMLFQDD